GPRSWLPEQRKRSLFIESQGHIQRKQGSPVAETPGDGARVPVFPQAPSPALAPVPAAPTPPPRFYITRLAPVFRSSQFVGAPGGVNGLYSPPTTEPHTGIGGGAAVFSSPVADECINMCEFRNNFGGCDLNATDHYIFGDGDNTQPMPMFMSWEFVGALGGVNGPVINILRATFREDANITKLRHYRHYHPKLHRTLKGRHNTRIDLDS
ncbi:uncharacterized protein LOC119591133, partial [Penaeus monodon]|uniref:uncharacterized protein LOC119591133 n=1 Tax=Penaeus monodon TaxID=6687 RepID=UPI0018A78A9A